MKYMFVEIDGYCLRMEWISQESATVSIFAAIDIHRTNPLAGGWAKPIDPCAFESVSDDPDLTPHSVDKIWIPTYVSVFDLSYRNKGLGKLLLKGLSIAIKQINSSFVLAPSDIHLRYSKDYYPGCGTTSVAACHVWDSIFKTNGSYYL